MAQFPIAFGAITVSYNLPGVKSGLKLDGKTLADIFLGKVKKWNDPEIKALNPGMSLPSTVDHGRSPLGLVGHDEGLRHLPVGLQPGVDGRGRQARQDRQVADRHRRAKGNSGVAAAVKQTAGAIGYVEQAYALQNGFTYAVGQEQSRASSSLPTISAASAAAEGIKVPPDLSDLDDQLARTPPPIRSSRRRS